MCTSHIFLTNSLFLLWIHRLLVVATSESLKYNVLFCIFLIGACCCLIFFCLGLSAVCISHVGPGPFGNMSFRCFVPINSFDQKAQGWKPVSHSCLTPSFFLSFSLPLRDSRLTSLLPFCLGTHCRCLYAGAADACLAWIGWNGRFWCILSGDRALGFEFLWRAVAGEKDKMS